MRPLAFARLSGASLADERLYVDFGSSDGLAFAAPLTGMDSSSPSELIVTMTGLRLDCPFNRGASTKVSSSSSD